MGQPKVYLAGPDVFYPQALALGRKKQQICARYGMIGCYPLDNEIDDVNRVPKREAGLKIFQANIDLMSGCDAVIANMTPFRGPSCDPGTAFEMGYMFALGRPVFAYSNTAQPFPDRTVEFFGRPEDARDRNDHLIEDFDLTDNLMLDGSVLHWAEAVIVRDIPPDKRDTNLEGFEEAVQRLAKRLHAEVL